MKKNPKTKKVVEIEKVIVMFAVVINHKIVLSKGLKEKMLLKKGNVRIIIFHLCQILLGVS